MRVVDSGAGVDFDTPQGKIHLAYKKTTDDNMVTFTMTQEALADLINMANTGFPEQVAMPGFVQGPILPVPMQSPVGIGATETTVTTTTVKR